MSDATPAPYTFTVTVVTAADPSTGAPIIKTYQVQGAFVDIKGDVYVITDNDGGIVAAVHTYGTVITRDDAVTTT